MATERIKNLLNDLNIDFVKYRYICGGLSVVAVVAAWVLFFVYPGPNWGIDFTGGTEIHLKFEDDVDVGEIRKALHQLGLSEDAVYSVGPAEKHEFKVRIQDATFGADDARKDVEQRLVGKYGADWIEHTTFNAEVGARVVVTYKGPEVQPREVQKLFADLEGVSVRSGSLENQLVVQLPGLSHQIETRIREVMPDREFSVLKTDAVGPKVGAELRVQAFIAIIATMALVLTYIAFRFDLAFAPGAIVALVHDVSLVAGAFVIFDKEFSLSIIGALLTILGYSLNDTVIIYDRLRENKERYPRISTADLINRSVNETLTRTVSTNFAVMLAISPFLIIGGPVVSDFAFAMTIGIIVGTYSTIYVASPLIMVMDEIKPYLNRIIVGNKVGTAMATTGPGGGGGEDAADAPSDRPLTESEKRRRERAQREKADRQGSNLA